MGKKIALFTLLSIAFLWFAVRTVRSISTTDSDFFTFWLAGWMNWARQNPYSSQQWIAGHTRFGAVWIPNPIFPYPLPLAVFLAPLGLLALEQAYVLWFYTSEAAILIFLVLIVGMWPAPKATSYLFPLVAGAFLFRPTLITLQNGQLGAIFLLILALTLLLWERERWFLGGLCLALVALKPTLGMPLLLLAGLWLAGQKKYAALAGIFLSTTILALMGYMRDPAWIAQFLAVGNRKLGETLGYSPTLWGLSGAICRHDWACTVTLGGILSICLLAFTSYILLKKGASLSPLIALSLILPVTVLITPYLWAYDQILLLIPISVATLWIAREGYPFLMAALYPIAMALLAILLLALAMQLGHDGFSALVSLVSLIFVGWLIFRADSDITRPMQGG